MKSHHRDRLVRVQRATATQNSFGEEILVWADIARGFGWVRYGSGAERRAAAQERAEQTITIGLLASPTVAGVKPTDRAIVDGATWNIAGIAFSDGEVVLTAARAGDAE